MPKDLYTLKSKLGPPLVTKHPKFGKSCLTSLRTLNWLLSSQWLATTSHTHNRMDVLFDVKPTCIVVYFQNKSMYDHSKFIKIECTVVQKAIHLHKTGLFESKWPQTMGGLQFYINQLQTICIISTNARETNCIINPLVVNWPQQQYCAIPVCSKKTKQMSQEFM